MNATLSGFGITLGPESVLNREINKGNLVKVLPDYQGPSRPMHIIVPPDKRRTVKVKCFIEAVREAFPPSGLMAR